MEFIENRFFYAILLILSMLYPLIQSFEKRIEYYKKWKRLLPSIIFMMLLFIPWDIYFTKNQIWSFNMDYTLGIQFLALPIEEWLFFIIIPFACVFIYEVLNYYFSKHLELKTYRILSLILSIILIVLSVIYSDRMYSMICFTLTATALLLLVIYQPKWMGLFFRAYLISLLPFLLVNGFLTGSFTTNPIVSYHENHIIGLRILNIPIEDSIYSLLMFLMVIGTYQKST